MEVLQVTGHRAKTSNMRWLLLSLFILITACVKYPETEAGTYDYQGTAPARVMALAEAIRSEYTPEATIYIVAEQPLGYSVSGLANQLGPHTYLIQFHTNCPDPAETIFHEMGHIIDSETGRLDFRGYMYWDGVRCDWSIPWSERPWEISANEWRDTLLEQYKNRQLKNYDYSVDAYLILKDLRLPGLNLFPEFCPLP